MNAKFQRIRLLLRLKRIWALILAVGLTTNPSLMADPSPSSTSKTQTYNQSVSRDVVYENAARGDEVDSDETIVSEVQEQSLEPSPPQQINKDKETVAPQKTPEIPILENKQEATTNEKISEKLSEAEQSLTELNNQITLSGAGVAVAGDKQQFMQRHGISNNFSGGIEDFHYENQINKDWTYEMNARGLFDNHDTLLQLGVKNPDVGYIDTGYQEFRTWYDGSGGFFPKSNTWFGLYDDQVFSIDRGKIWFESGLTLPDLPVFTFRYTHDTRNGNKDSTSWAETSITGGFGQRKIVPSFRNIDETRDIFEGDMKHTIDTTSFGIGLRYELSDQNNALYLRRTPYTATDRSVTQRDIVNTDMFNVHTFTETRFSENTLFTTAYSFTTLDTDLGGSRIYAAGFNQSYIPFLAQRQANDEGFLNLAGGARENQHVLNMSYMTVPLDDFTMILALRAEDRQLDVLSKFTETNVGAAPALTPALTNELGTNNTEQLNVAQSVELRYTAIQNWVFYMKATWEEGDGNLTETLVDTDTGLSTMSLDEDIHRFTQKYAFGANWYPLKRVNLATQYYHRIRSTAWDLRDDSTPNLTGNRYPGYLTEQDITTDDANVRVTWRPFNNLTSVSRYDFQLNTFDTHPDSLDMLNTATIPTHIFGQNVTWSPLTRLYLQGNANWVLSKTDTPADSMLGAAQNEVWDSLNNYWNGSFLVGYALTKTTDLQAQYTYYRAYDYRDNSSTGLPYGADTEEQGVTLGLLWRLSDSIRWNFKYGFFRNLDKTSGGNNNYDAHLAYASMQVAF